MSIIQKIMLGNILLLDYDGVMRVGPQFSQIYSNTFGVPIENLLPLFKEMSETVTIGTADLKDLLPKYVDSWGWSKSIDKLIDYWVKSDTGLDDRFPVIISLLKEKGVKIYLATDQEKYRGTYIWETYLKDLLDGKFISCEIGYKKSDPEFFKHIIKHLNVEPSQICFFDDSEEKVNSAKFVGINAYQYTDFEAFSKIIDNLYLKPL